MKKSNLILGTLVMIFTFGLFTTYANSAKEASEMTVVEIAISNDQFSILVEAVVKADLADALSAEGPYTVFAPTNEAFEKLFEALGVSGVNDLTKDQLTPILLYHVVSGKVMAADVRSGKVSTLNNGASMMVKVTGKGVQIDKKSNVIVTDVEASNGVIHVIDAVLIPASADQASTSGSCGN